MSWKAPKDWAKIRKKVLERDHWTCQVCEAKIGKGGRRAHVHHRIGRNHSLLRDLVSVCASCHSVVTLLSLNAKALALDEGLLAKAVELAKEYLRFNSKQGKDKQPD